MGIIMHNDIPYGGGSSIEPNPQESATEQLETLGIDGDVYEVTDANAIHTSDVGIANGVAELDSNGKVPKAELPSDVVYDNPTFTEASTRANIASGETIATILGKIKKFFSDLKTVAFTGAYSDLSGTPTIPTVNNGTLTIKQNNNNLGTFTANQSTASNINIECATPSDVEGSKVATGNPLTITDAAGIKAEKIEIDFDPKQDKHGYNSVWVGGAGKNKLNATVRTQTARSVQYTMAANNFLTVNGTATGNSDYAFLLDSPINLKAGDTIYFKLLNFSGSVGSNIGVWLNDYATFIGYLSVNNVMTIQYTCEADVQITYFIYRHYLSNVANNYTANVSLSVGESLSQFYPYENICPITGYTSLSADRCGKQLFDKDATDTSKGYVANYFLTVDGELTSNSSYCISEYIRIPEAEYISFGGGYHGWEPSVCFYDINKNFISGVKWNARNSFAATRPSNAAFVRVSYNTANVSQLQVEEGVASTYEPFKGDSVLVEFNQTLYGGKLTILQDGSADVYVDTGYFDNTSSDYEYNSTAKVFVIKKSIPNVTVLNSVAQDAISNAFVFYPATTVYNQNDITGICFDQLNNCYFRIQGYTTEAEYTTFLVNNPLQVAYKLSTPFTLHLSPVEALTLLQGINNVWTDGTTLSLTYQPDNAIGQAKGTAQDAMAMVNALASTAVKVIAKKGQYEMGVRDWVDMPDCSLSLDKGTYLIMGWCNLTGDNYHSGSTYYRYGCAIADSSNNRLVGNTFKPDSNQAYEASISTCLLETITTDATVRKLKGYMGYSSNSYPIKGGIIAFKIA